MRLVNRLRFAKDDPLRYLHVPKKDRLDDDGGDDSDAITETGEAGPADDEFDYDEVRAK